MIKSFLDKDTENFYISSKSKKIHTSIQKVALRKLDYIIAAICLDDLRVPPANHLEKLQGNLESFYSIRINNQYRIIFRFEDENAFDIKVIDYH